MNFRENIAYMKYFGVELTFWKTLNKLIVGDLEKSKGIIRWHIHEINNNIIEKYLIKTCPKTYKKFCVDHNYVFNNFNKPKMYDEVKRNSVIWTFWWQGEENAPELVRACIKSIRKYSNGHQVIVLDKNNILDYISLPSPIWELFCNAENDNSDLKTIGLGKIHMVDICRAWLLFHYGGVWSDATLLFTNDIPEYYFTEKFTTLGQDNEWYIGRGKWSLFFMGGLAGNILYGYIYEMLFEYWSKKKYYVNYLMKDHIIDIAYKNIPGIDIMIDNVKSGNKKCITLQRHYCEVVDKEKIALLLEYQSFHKLSWRWWGQSADSQVQLRVETGEETWFGYIFEKYIENK